MVNWAYNFGSNSLGVPMTVKCEPNNFGANWVKTEFYNVTSTWIINIDRYMNDIFLIFYYWP